MEAGLVIVPNLLRGAGERIGVADRDGTSSPSRPGQSRPTHTWDRRRPIDEPVELGSRALVEQAQRLMGLVEQMRRHRTARVQLSYSETHAGVLPGHVQRSP